MLDPRLWRRLAVLGAVVLTLFALMAGLGPRQRPADCAVANAILCAELPADVGALAEALSPSLNPPSAWRTALVLDMGFLVAYGLMLCLGAWLLGARAAGLAFAVAPLLDAVENVGLWRALDAPSPALARLVSLSAAAKFALLGLGALLCWRAAGQLPTRGTQVSLRAAGIVGAPAFLVFLDPRAALLGSLATAIALATLWVAALRLRAR